MSNSYDDFWGSDSDDNSTFKANEESIEIRKLRARHSKRGYLDGLTYSKEENLQAGFNTSFPEGCDLGLKVGLILGTLQLLAAYYGPKDEKLRNDFSTAQKELKINSILSKTNFDENFDLIGDKHPIIDKWEKKLKDYQGKYF